MKAIESGSHDSFLENLRETGNTVCGRHPIGVMMAALEVLAGQEGGEGDDGHKAPNAEGGSRKERLKFRFIRYERSGDCVKIGDSSVSYASAFAIL